MKKILIYLDIENIQNSLELLEVANQIYDESDYKTYAVILNHPLEEIIEKITGKFDFVINVADEKIKNYDSVAITNVMEELEQKHEFDSIIIPATHFGRMLAPRLAMRLHVGLVADVTEIKKDGENLELVRPAFSGRIMAGIVTNDKKPLMLSVRQNVFSLNQEIKKDTEIINYKPLNYNSGDINLIDSKENKESYDIRESKILVSGGGGILNHFDEIKSLADKLDAQVSASRKIIDNGKASRNIQVGQSGKTVSPDLYIALGISGAIEHIAGLKNVEHIIAVNINKDAPICSISDIVVKGDANNFIKKFKNKLN